MLVVSPSAKSTGTSVTVSCYIDGYTLHKQNKIIIKILSWINNDKCGDAIHIAGNKVIQIQLWKKLFYSLHGSLKLWFHPNQDLGANWPSEVIYCGICYLSLRSHFWCAKFFLLRREVVKVNVWQAGTQCPELSWNICWQIFETFRLSRMLVNVSGNRLRCIWKLAPLGFWKRFQEVYLNDKNVTR